MWQSKEQDNARFFTRGNLGAEEQEQRILLSARLKESFYQVGINIITLIVLNMEIFCPTANRSVLLYAALCMRVLL